MQSFLVVVRSPQEAPGIANKIFDYEYGYSNTRAKETGDSLQLQTNR